MTFTFRPRAGGRIRADIATAADGPHVWLSLTNTRGEHAAVFIPLANVEEVIAGLRDMARQAAGQAGTSWTSCTPAWLATQPAGACDTTPRRDGHDDVSHYHLAAEGAAAVLPPGATHGCPSDGSGLTPCCSRTPFELPRDDRISSEAAVTCTGRTAAEGADRA